MLAEGHAALEEAPKGSRLEEADGKVVKNGSRLQEADGKVEDIWYGDHSDFPGYGDSEVSNIHPNFASFTFLSST